MSIKALLREKKGEMSAAAAARQIGISKATFGRLEKGGTPDMATYEKVVAWLGSGQCPASELLSRHRENFDYRSKRLRDCLTKINTSLDVEQARLAVASLVEQLDSLSFCLGMHAGLFSASQGPHPEYVQKMHILP